MLIPFSMYNGFVDNIIVLASIIDYPAKKFIALNMNRHELL
jgi:hypothetical protein